MAEKKRRSGDTPRRATPEDVARISHREYGSSMPAILRLLLYEFAVSHNKKYEDPKFHTLNISDIHHIQAVALEMLDVEKDAKIADVGCGDGSTLANLAM